MARPKNAIPSKKLHLALPGDIGTKLDIFLYSAVEQRIPHAAHQRFVVERLREYFDSVRLPLGPYLGSGYMDAAVSGSPESIEALKRFLERK